MISAICALGKNVIKNIIITTNVLGVNDSGFILAIDDVNVLEV